MLDSYVSGKKSRQAVYSLRNLATNIERIMIINLRFDPTNREYDT